MDFIINFLVAAVAAGTPLLFGTLGEIMNERVGHLNLGVEGMMSIGACAGFLAGYHTDNFNWPSIFPRQRKCHCLIRTTSKIC